MQSFFIGIGAVIAGALPWAMTNWMGMSNVAPAGEIPETVRWAFYIGGAALLAAVSWTVFTTREFSPEQLAAFDAARQAGPRRSEEHTSELQSLMRISYAVFCLKKKK